MDKEKIPFSDLKESIIDRINRCVPAPKSEGMFIRLEFLTEVSDPLLWLKAQPNKEKIYFEPRGKDEPAIAGAGSSCPVVPVAEDDLASYFKKLNRFISEGLICYGGASFVKNQPVENEWRSFNKFNFILPRFEYMIRDKKGYLTVNLGKKELKGLNMEALINEVEALNVDIPHKFEKSVKTEFISYTPNKKDWVNGVTSYLKKIGTGEIEKIVAARRVDLKTVGEIDPFRVVSDLKKSGDYAANFLFTFNGSDFFIGSSPERLFHREGDLLTTESVAGTISRGSNPVEDEKFGNLLQGSDKETREHDFVTDDIVSKIDPICEPIVISERVLLKLANLQHLYRRISGKLKRGISDGDILEMVYPTPAVCGLPLNKCLTLLRKGEAFQRGWYAGVVGFAGKDISDYYVGIRSILISGKNVFVYSGAGIVAGSDPAKEWDEIELKTSKYKKILKYET